MADRLLREFSRVRADHHYKDEQESTLQRYAEKRRAEGLELPALEGSGKGAEGSDKWSKSLVANEVNPEILRQQTRLRPWQKRKKVQLRTKGEGRPLTPAEMRIYTHQHKFGLLGGAFDTSFIKVVKEKYPEVKVEVPNVKKPAIREPPASVPEAAEALTRMRATAARAFGYGTLIALLATGAATAGGLRWLGIEKRADATVENVQAGIGAKTEGVKRLIGGSTATE